MIIKIPPFEIFKWRKQEVVSFYRFNIGLSVCQSTPLYSIVALYSGEFPIKYWIFPVRCLAPAPRSEVGTRPMPATAKPAGGGRDGGLSEIISSVYLLRRSSVSSVILIIPHCQQQQPQWGRSIIIIIWWIVRVGVIQSARIIGYQVDGVPSVLSEKNN